MPNEAAERRATLSSERSHGRALSRNLPGAFPPRLHQQNGMVVEESDESAFWLELLGRSGISETQDQKSLLQETRELLAIFKSSAKTASDNFNRQ